MNPISISKDSLYKALKYAIIVVVVCAVWHPLADKVLIPFINLISGIIP